MTDQQQIGTEYLREIQRTCATVRGGGGFGCLYVLQRQNGVVKVGKSKNPLSRMRSHVRFEQKASGLDGVMAYVSAPIFNFSACELLLIDAMRQAFGDPVAGVEEFGGGDAAFKHAQDFIAGTILAGGRYVDVAELASQQEETERFTAIRAEKPVLVPLELVGDPRLSDADIGAYVRICAALDRGEAIGFTGDHDSDSSLEALISLGYLQEGEQ